MVQVHLPPPHVQVHPRIVPLRAGFSLVRIFDPTDHGQTALSFRFYGPLKRFDHHRAFAGNPAVDPERGIYYAAFGLAGCLAEVFGDNSTRRVEPGEKYVASLSVTREVRLLDLRGKGGDNGAILAGSVAALTSNADYAPSQAWSRYFYGTPDAYTEIDGIVYSNAHNNDDALALYERCADVLSCSPDDVLRLDDPFLRPLLQETCLQIHLVPPT